MEKVADNESREKLSSAKSLRSYLKTVSEAGSYESSGRFTVDVEKRRMKLRLNQFHDPTHYLLCCVRAAVTSGSDSVEIRLGYRKTRIILRAPKELVAKELLEGVLGGGSGGETERLLGAAFQGGLNVGATKVRVAIPGALVELTQDSMAVTPTEQEQLDCEIEFSYRHTFREARKRCALETSAIYVRGAFCPVPLLLDGLSVGDASGWEGLFQWQRSAYNYGVDRDFVWLEALMSEADQTFSCGVSLRRSRVEFLGGERYSSQEWVPTRGTAFLRIAPANQGERPRAGSLTRLGSKLEGPSFLFLIRQGVVLDAVEANLGAPGIGVVVREDELKTDASMFKPVEDEDFFRLLKRLQAQTRGLIYHLGRERKSLTLHAPEEPASVVWKSLLSGFGGGACFGYLTGPLGGLLFGGASLLVVTSFLLARNSDRALTERERNIRWELDTYVGLVAPKADNRLRL